jgi:chromosome segregation ATPase
LVEQAKEKEEKARKIIQDLRNEIAHLNKIVEQGSGLSIGQDNTVHNLMRQKDELNKEVAQKTETINDLETQKTSLMERIHKLENDLIREKDDIEKYRHEIEKLKDDKSREERKNKYAEEEKKNL